MVNRLQGIAMLMSVIDICVSQHSSFVTVLFLLVFSKAYCVVSGCWKFSSLPPPLHVVFMCFFMYLCVCLLYFSVICVTLCVPSVL